MKSVVIILTFRLQVALCVGRVILEPGRADLLCHVWSREKEGEWGE